MWLKNSMKLVTILDTVGNGVTKVIKNLQCTVKCELQLVDIVLIKSENLWYFYCCAHFIKL